MEATGKAPSAIGRNPGVVPPLADLASATVGSSQAVAGAFGLVEVSPRCTYTYSQEQTSIRNLSVPRQSLVINPSERDGIVCWIDNLCPGRYPPVMIERTLSTKLRELAGYYPIVTVTGPRQSGKTTLCRACFPDRPYVSLERHDTRDAARTDPRGFLETVADGAVLDEVQHVPELLSYLQAEVDERPEPGRFVLTGSQHFGLTEQVAQSLAGRTGVLFLLPPSLDELRRFPEPPASLWETLWAGAYPRIHDRRIPADRWLADYVTTYVQRDVRQVLRVGDLQTFTTFLKLCAGRTGQVVNLSSLGGDAGVSHNTARAWLSVLETSLLVFRLPPWHRNLKKQLVKAPKLHFLDAGLACHLLGIRSPEQLRHHPLRGAIFESWCVSEVYKARAHRGLSADLFYFRDHKGLEVDLVVETGDAVLLGEMKSGATIAGDFFGPLTRLAGLLGKTGDWRPVRQIVFYGGVERQRRNDALALPWSAIDTALAEPPEKAS